MKTFFARMILVLIVFATALTAFADIPNPNKKQKTESQKIRMHIYGNRDTSEATLKIPRDLLVKLKAEADGDKSLNASASLTKTQTIFIGLCLSLSLFFGGVWFVRSRGNASGKGSRALIALAFLTLLTATATSVYANLGPPLYARTLTTKILDPEVSVRGAFGDVKVEVGEDGSEIYLALPRPKEDK